jgi:hypothetical protein
MKLKLIRQSPSDKNRVNWIEAEVAWVAAQAIASRTHHAVILYGTYGTARFRHDGGGHVEWNERSTLPGTTTDFSASTTVCIW